MRRTHQSRAQMRHALSFGQWKKLLSRGPRTVSMAVPRRKDQGQQCAYAHGDQLLPAEVVPALERPGVSRLVRCPRIVADDLGKDVHSRHVEESASREKQRLRQGLQCVEMSFQAVSNLKRSTTEKISMVSPYRKVPPDKRSAWRQRVCRVGGRIEWVRFSLLSFPHTYATPRGLPGNRKGGKVHTPAPARDPHT